MKRRNFIKHLGFLSAASALIPILQTRKALAATTKFLVSPFSFWRSSPLQRASQANGSDFNGDEPDGPHDVFWNLQDFIKRNGGIPLPEEERELVIVGGGLGGLSSAYLLRHKKPLLLEQAKQFGGNAKAEQYGSSQYPLGAVYISEPEPGTPTHRLLQEIGVLSLGRVERAQDSTVFFQKKINHGFWQGATDPTMAANFEEVFRELNSWITNSRKNDLLNLSNTSSEAQALDSISFESWLRNRFGQLHPHLLEYFQLYGWSSFLASIDELSARQMLGFIAAETDSIMTFPGGLGAISQGIYQKLQPDSRPEDFRTSCMAIDIRVINGKTQICYIDAQRKLHTVLAKKCIFAGPKFVAKRIVQAPQDQLEAWNKITYRAYVVGNVILDAPIASPSFELYCLDGEMPPTPSFIKTPKRLFSDACFASWASFDRASHGVITVFCGLAYNGANQYLFSPMAHSKFKERVLTGIQPLLSLLGKKNQNILGVRLTRWGHAMPVAYAGLVASGLPAKIRRPIGNTLYFVNQDNWINPCFETAFSEAREMAEEISKG